MSLVFLAFLLQQTISGMVTINIQATDASGVASVQCLLDGQSLGVLTAPTTPPNTYLFSWNTATVQNGAHTLTTKAIDVPGNIGTAFLAVNVLNTIPDTMPPTVQFVTPIAGMTVTGKFNVMASASDNVGVSQMQFYVRGQLRKTAPGAALGYSWNTAPDKKYSPVNLTTTAIDAAGNLASQTITVQIK